MKKILILGINGFTGMHLWNYLKCVEKKDVIGTYNRTMDSHRKKYLKGCQLKQCNINDYRQLRKILIYCRPEQIYYLPAIVTVAESFVRAVSIYETNILGISKFFEAVVASRLKSKILITGSVEEYGKVKKSDLPIRETCPLNPVNPYGLSKSLQEQLAWYYVFHHRVLICMTRTFHFAGPWQSPSFVISDFARQIARIEAGLTKPVISIGCLDIKRDFTDIRDVVRAYHFIMNKVKKPDVFNVCQGRSVSIKVILKKLLEKAKRPISVRRDPKKMRKADVPDFRGDNTKLIGQTGWRPDFCLDRTLDDILNWHRANIHKG